MDPILGTLFVLLAGGVAVSIFRWWQSRRHTLREFPKSEPRHNARDIL